MEAGYTRRLEVVAAKGVDLIGIGLPLHSSDRIQCPCKHKVAISSSECDSEIMRLTDPSCMSSVPTTSVEDSVARAVPYF